MGYPATKPTILLVHGAWHGAWCWEDEFAPYLRKQGWPVESIDLPGHGVTSTGKRPWFKIADYVDAVEAKLTALGSPSIVVGHSMGGYVLQKLMERRPDRLAGAVLMAAATQRGVFGVIKHLLATRPIDFIVTNLTCNLYHLTRTPQMAKALFHADDMSDVLLQEHWARLGHESYRAFLDMMLLAPLQPNKADPSLPKLVLGGEHDAIFPPAIVQQTAQRYNVKAKIYSDMPHNLMQNKHWRTVADDIAHWASEIPFPA